MLFHPSGSALHLGDALVVDFHAIVEILLRRVAASLIRASASFVL
jgi:hypothetical protein